MKKQALYTIGHGSRKAEDFLALLKEYGIEYLVDVRSKPFSRFHPQFNQKALQSYLENNQVHYVFMGNELGGRPSDASCYTQEGKVDYERIKTKDFFKQGIERLKVALRKQLRVAIMCSERNPCECHRTLLIGKVLYADGLILKHIDEQGKLKDHTRVMNEVDGNNKGQADLFS